MQPLSFYTAFIGTVISIVCWINLFVKEHNPKDPLTLSELAASKIKSLRYFRIVLWTCTTLFGITMFFYILPRINNKVSTQLLIVFLFSIICYFLLGVFAARGKVENILHNIFADGIALGGIVGTFILQKYLSSPYKEAEITLLLAMIVLSILALSDKKRYIIYELQFIFASHFTIIVAALALR
jgi:hypothetical protein